MRAVSRASHGEAASHTRRYTRFLVCMNETAVAPPKCTDVNVSSMLIGHSYLKVVVAGLSFLGVLRPRIDPQQSKRADRRRRPGRAEQLRMSSPGSFFSSTTPIHCNFQDGACRADEESDGSPGSIISCQPGKWQAALGLEDAGRGCAPPG